MSDWFYIPPCRIRKNPHCLSVTFGLVSLLHFQFIPPWRISLFVATTDVKPHSGRSVMTKYLTHSTSGSFLSHCVDFVIRHKSSKALLCFVLVIWLYCIQFCAWTKLSYQLSVNNTVKLTNTLLILLLPLLLLLLLVVFCNTAVVPVQLHVYKSQAVYPPSSIIGSDQDTCLDRLVLRVIWFH